MRSFARRILPNAHDSGIFESSVRVEPSSHFDLAVAKGAAIYAQGGVLTETTMRGTELTEAGSSDAEPTDKMLHLNGRTVTVKTCDLVVSRKACP